MINLKINKFFFIPLLLLFSFTIANAQGGNNFDKPNDAPPNRQDRLREVLGLTDEQVIQIQLIRRKQAPLLRDAQIRQQQTKKKLDDVIYADQFVEADVEIHLKNFLEAQAEVTKLRLMNELAVRRVLTPDQLKIFKTIRQNAQERRERRNEFRQQRRQNQNRRNNRPQKN